MTNTFVKNTILKGCECFMKLPLQVAVYFMLTTSKFLIDGMVCAYLVPRSSRLWLHQVAYIFDFNEEYYADKKTYKNTVLALLVTYVLLDFAVVGIRRLRANYQFVTFNAGLGDKITDAKSKLLTLNFGMRIVVLAGYFVIFLLYYISLYIYSVQSQQEFIKEYPNFLEVRQWNDNPYAQNFIAAFFILASAVINFFEGLHNAIVIVQDKKMLINRKAFLVIISSLSLAFMIRLFVLKYVKDTAIGSRVSALMQVSFVVGTVGFSLATTGFSYIMKSTSRYIQDESFKGKPVVQMILAIYLVLGALLCQGLGNYNLLMMPFSSHSESMQKPWSCALFSLGMIVGGVSMYLYVNYIKNQVYDSCKAIIDVASSRCHYYCSFFNDKSLERQALLVDSELGCPAAGIN